MFKKLADKFIKLINNFIIKLNLNIKLSNFIKIQNGIRTLSTQENRYQKIKSIEETECKIFSQNGEDGIINYLIKSLKIKNPNFIEIGVGDYSECNTRYIFESTSPKGLIIDCIKDFREKVKKNVKLWKGDLLVLEKIVTPENFIEILKKHDFNNNLDLFSIDIDGLDYWVLKKIPENFSKIIVAEYNAVFGEHLEITVPNIENFERTNYHYSNLCFGASLKAIVKLMKSKNYVFIGTNLTRVNAFFVAKNQISNLNIDIPDDNDLKDHVDSNIRESRNQKSKLTYISGKKKLELIKECNVINLKNNELVSIKKLLEESI